jgi:hypothetical protein
MLLDSRAVSSGALGRSYAAMARRADERNNVYMERASKYVEWLLFCNVEMAANTLPGAVIRDTMYLDGGLLSFLIGFDNGTYDAVDVDQGQYTLVKTSRLCHTEFSSSSPELILYQLLAALRYIAEFQQCYPLHRQARKQSGTQCLRRGHVRQ